MIKVHNIMSTLMRICSIEGCEEFRVIWHLAPETSMMICEIYCGVFDQLTAAAAAVLNIAFRLLQNSVQWYSVYGTPCHCCAIAHPQLIMFPSIALDFGIQTHLINLI